MQMIYKLIVDIPYILVDSFDSAMGFQHQVLYGRCIFGVESLHICHSVGYPYPLECIDAQSYSVEVDISVKCLHTYQFLSEMFSISQGIDKVTHIFQFVFVSTFIIVHFWIVSPP